MSASNSHSDVTSRRWRIAGIAAVCLAFSLGLHVVGAVALSVFPFGAVTPPIASVDPGAHSIRVMIVPPAPPLLDPIEPPPPPPPPPEPTSTPIEPPPPLPLSPLLTLNEILLTFATPPTQEHPHDPITSNVVIPTPSPPILKHEPLPDAQATQDVPPPTELIDPEPVIEIVIPVSKTDDAGASTGVKIIGDIAPKYPSRSRRLGEQGLVVLDVHVLPTGKAGEIRVRQNPGHRRLVSAAIDAVRSAKFTPATRHDKPVAAWLNVPVRFVIE